MRSHASPWWSEWRFEAEEKAYRAKSGWTEPVTDSKGNEWMFRFDDSPARNLMHVHCSIAGWNTRIWF